MPWSRFAPLALAVSFAAPPALGAQAADTPPSDTGVVAVLPDTAASQKIITRRDVWFSSAFLAASIGVAQLDAPVARRLQDSARVPSDFTTSVKDLFNSIGIPGAFVVTGGLFVAGRVSGKRALADAGLHAIEAVVLAEVTTYVAKYAFGRERPYAAGPRNPGQFEFGGGFKGEAFKSMPSGHAAGAFAAAAALTAEASSRWPKSTYYVAPIMFGSAALVGWARLQSNAHWLSDVFLGAGIGTLAGIKVVRYNHKHPHNVLDRVLLGALPKTVTPSRFGPGVTLTWSIQPAFLSAPW